MKGKYRIVVQNKKIKYDFEIKRNITVIRGDSATGKTTLVDMIREYYENGEDSGIELNCQKECIVLEGRSWHSQLNLFTSCIIFIDEGNNFVSSKEFAEAIQNTNNYYVIVTRESLPALPYSVSEIYGIRNSGKYGHLKQTYNEFYHIYHLNLEMQKIVPDVVVTEDSHSGYQFFSSICSKNDIACKSAGGKSNIFGMLGTIKDDKVLIIADGAAFGPEMEKIMKQISLMENAFLYLPESFEWLILRSGLLKDNDVIEMLDEPYNYVESKEYFSWERYFTHMLVEKTENTYLKYSKNKLNDVYLQENVLKKILDVMDKIDFEKE